MNALVIRREHNRDRMTNALALLVLIVIGGLALVGPSGLLAWGEQSARLSEHEQRILQLQAQRDEMQNRVALLAPNNVDADYADELVRGNLNVAHPDEYIVELDTAD